jgi:hypothetical protein
MNKMKNQIGIMLVSIKKNKVRKLNSQRYFIMPAGYDFYNQFREMKENNPMDNSKNTESNGIDERKAIYEKYLLDEMCGNYLDMPAAELENEP